ncbi:unnamed protein product, partial [Allacma fusca]
LELQNYRHVHFQTVEIKLPIYGPWRLLDDLHQNDLGYTERTQIELHIPAMKTPCQQLLEWDAFSNP